jgi:4-hydroxy-2-oxoheptanedioate aldolase
MQVVQSTRYPPQGVRGYASGTRACGYGRDRQYASRANELVCLVVMAETKTALGNIGAIARIEGVDAVYIGAADLAADMGFMGQPSHPEVKARIESAVRSIVAAGCVAGISVQNAALYAEYRELGATLFNIGQDVHIFANALDRQIETVLQAPPQSLSH